MHDHFGDDLCVRAGGGLVPYEGENGSLSVSKSLSAVLEKAPGSAAAVRYSHESPESSGHDYYTDEGLEDPESEIEEDEEDSDPTWDLAHATPKLRC